MNFDGTTIAKATDGTLVRDAPRGPVCTDTRNLPEGAWFLALVGDRFDGHDYVDAALEAGAAGVIVDRVAQRWTGGVVRVADTTRALQDLGRFVRQRYPCPVVALTGSSGKTTTRALTALALSPLGEVHQTRGNLNNHLGVPMTLVAAPFDSAAMVVEMGTSSPGEIQFLAELVEPDIRILVNVGPAHLEELGGLEGVALEKGALFRTASPGDTVVVNELDALVRRIEIPDGVRCVTVGAEGSDIRVLSAQADPKTLATRAVFETPEGRLSAVLPVLGMHFALDAALALGAAWAAGVNLESAALALEKYEPVGMRMRVEEVGGATMFNDAYNANPASMRASLDALALLGGRRVAVMGDMLELGPDEHAFHEEVVAHADALGFDLLVLVGDRMGAAAQVASHTETWVPEDRKEAGERLAAWLLQGDHVLFKGSRGAKTEEVLEHVRARAEEG